MSQTASLYNPNSFNFGTQNQVGSFDPTVTDTGQYVADAFNFGGASAAPGNIAMAKGGTGNTADAFSWTDFLFGSSNKKTGVQTPGALLPGLQTLGQLGNLWLGTKQYDLAKKSLKSQQLWANRDYAARRNTTNAAMAGNQAALLSFTNGKGASVADHMAQYGVA